MTAAFSRLLFISSATIVSLVLALMGLRFLGSLQTFGQSPIKLMQDPAFWIIAEGTGPSDLEKAQPGLSAKVFFKLDFGLNEQTWTFRGEPADKALADHAAHRIVANLDTNYPLHMVEFFKKISSIFGHDNALIMSPSSRVTSRAREVDAQFVFVADSAHITQGELFTALFIETMMNFKYDIYVLNLQKRRPSTLLTRLAEELRRRYKKIVVRTDDFSEEKVHWIRQYAHGVMTNRPVEAARLFFLTSE